MTIPAPIRELAENLRVIRAWEMLRTSYWFIPVVITCAGIILTLAAGTADLLLREHRPFTFVEPEAARTVLSTTAGGAITVTGVIFSITIVVLSMASAQFGPRLLRNFMRHGSTQMVLGTFIAVFVSCLIMLVTIRDDSAPQISVLLGLGFGLVSFLLLIFFIHHVSLFIHAPRIIDDVADSLRGPLDTSFPALPDDTPDLRPPQDYDAPSPFPLPQMDSLPATDQGYLQVIEFQTLVRLAQEHDLSLDVVRRPGDFINQGQALLHYDPAANVDAATAAALRKCMVLGPERTGTQDPAFGIYQLVEIALRAMSSGINDPWTAINCLDRIGGAISIIADRRPAPALLRDKDGAPRLYRRPTSYAQLSAAAFDQIRQVAQTDTAVTLRLLQVIESLAEQPLHADLRQALSDQVEAIADATELAYERDRQLLASHLERTRATLDQGDGSG